MALSRRLQQFRLRLLGRHPADYAQELQEFLKAMWDQAMGIPGGWLGTTPPTIVAGSAGTAGSEAAGWQAADARPAIETATPSSRTGVTGDEGTGTALMRADATIPDAVIHEATLATDGYGLIADSTQSLKIRFIPALSRDEVEYFKTIFLASSSSNDRGVNRDGPNALCDPRFASDRRLGSSCSCTL
jgi:hypothetical protein